jgi:hypothetical protein
MSHRLSIRRALVSALLTASLAAALVPTMAGAATPRAGYYSGSTSQAGGSVDFKVMKYGSSNGTVRKFLKVGATTQLQCASGEVKEDYFSVYIISGGKVDRYGRFKYSYKGFNFKGRFTSRTSAKGTLSRTVGDCTSGSVNWTAKKGIERGLQLPS